MAAGRPRCRVSKTSSMGHDFWEEMPGATGAIPSRSLALNTYSSSVASPSACAGDAAGLSPLLSGELRSHPRISAGDPSLKLIADSLVLLCGVACGAVTAFRETPLSTPFTGAEFQ